jgi:hypothetical protein
MDETQEKSVIKSDSKEKIGDTITQRDLLHRLLSSYLPLILSYVPPCRPLRPSQEKSSDTRQDHGNHHHLSCLASARDLMMPLALALLPLCTPVSRLTSRHQP